jgi:hypothetical protein
MPDNIIRIGDKVKVIRGELRVFGGQVVRITSCFVKFTNDAGFLYQVKTDKVEKVMPSLPEEDMPPWPEEETPPLPEEATSSHQVAETEEGVEDIEI